nr:nucleotide pyrophosphohydrolase [Chitinophagaceae bacterium]
MHIKELQTQVDEWIQTYGVKYFSPLTNLGILMEEVGEVSRIMVREYGEQSKKESDEGKNLADELADVLWVLSAIANQCGVDLELALQNNMAKKTARDKERHQNNEKLQ